MKTNPLLHFFDSPPLRESLPKHFPFPFYHQPDRLSLTAAEKLKQRLQKNNFAHRFEEKGKMFGVLVVRLPGDQIAYLCGYSGKLQGDERPSGFVPPIVDVHRKGGFYKEGEKELDYLTAKIEKKKSSPGYIIAMRVFEEESLGYDSFLSSALQQRLVNKSKRDVKRKEAEVNKFDSEKNSLTNLLNQESRRDNYLFKKEKKERYKKLAEAEGVFHHLKNELLSLKEIRAAKSKVLQNAVFNQSAFLNFNGDTKSLLYLFKSSFEGTPPAGAGECAAPRLLQQCFLLGLEPVTFTEFWWGKPPKKELRVHNAHYPACRGKCEPILNHMLTGVSVEKNPLELLQKPSEIEILYNDEVIMLVNKPTGLLSVPGKNLKQSVISVIKKQIEDPGELFPVHRLDRQTSGVLLLAKSKNICSILQKQFEKRLVKKTYVALLDGLVKKEKGAIILPLVTDYLDRPRQLVCYEKGKYAETSFELIGVNKNVSRIRFYPKTGRSHQLRVHAAFHDGLNTPILGDDLYGRHDKRMFLHAEKLVFEHPISLKQIDVFSPTPF